MMVNGRGLVELTIGNTKVKHEVIITDITVDAILGMDFLVEQKCNVNIKEQLMYIHDQAVVK
jgi:hypothetical protein